VNPTLVTVALVGCSATKLDRPAPARDIYSSPLFRKSLAYAEHVLFAQHTFILSAKHGAVRPDAELAPYDLVLKAFEPWELGDWAMNVGIQLRDALGLNMVEPAPRNMRFVLLASDLYLPDLPLGAIVEKPLAGMQIGQRLSFLKSSLAAVPREILGRAA
jgi:hypothetical protein